MGSGGGEDEYRLMARRVAVGWLFWSADLVQANLQCGSYLQRISPSDTEALYVANIAGAGSTAVNYLAMCGDARPDRVGNRAAASCVANAPALPSSLTLAAVLQHLAVQP